MNKSEQITADFLQSLGLEVTRVPESESKSCDFLLSSGNEEYLLEVKARRDDPDLRRSVRDTGVGTSSAVTGRTNRASTILREAASQLESSACDPGIFRLIWLVIEPQAREQAIVHQVFATLYGLQELMLKGKDGGFESTHCMYFTHSEFHKHLELDAVGVHTSTGCSLCLNQFAARRKLFEDSHLYRQFREHNGVIKPNELVELNGWLLADTTIDRSNVEGVTEYVKSKYGIDYLQPVNFTQRVGVARVEDPGDA